MFFHINKTFKTSYVYFYYTDSNNQRKHIMKNFCNEFYYFNYYEKDWLKIKDLTNLTDEQLFQEELINEYDVSVYHIKKLQEMNYSVNLLDDYSFDLEI